MNLLPPSRPNRPAPWAIPLAFTLVYLSWGTTYIAIRVGVQSFPAALFGGARIGLAGLILLAYLGWRGDCLRLSRSTFLMAILIGNIFFTGGNYPLTLGERDVASGIAAILVATTPIWIALLEAFWPGGERLGLRGWFGLLIGLGGVAFLKLEDAAELSNHRGMLLIVGSAMAWALGACLLRRQRTQAAPLVLAAYQMIFGGAGQCLIGLATGELEELSADRFKPAAVYSFFHLLVIGSLVGFVAYNWLLGQVSASQAGTYAYVNPAVALVIGWLLKDQAMSPSILAGMIIILTGVALVRSDRQPPPWQRAAALASS